MKIAIFGNNYQDRYRKQLPVFFNLLRRKGIKVHIEDGFKKYLMRFLDEVRDFDTFAAAQLADGTLAVDYVLTLGGDGTLLHVSQLLGGAEVPVLGINTGHLGYLTSGSLDDSEAIVRQIANGSLAIERRTLLLAERLNGGLTQQARALNEVAILRRDTSSMIEMETRLNGDTLTTYKGDGLVVSTPSGSTAYNMSAGGPILAPTTACFVLTPVSPHSLTMRPLVVSDDSVLDITVRSRARDYQVSVDGNAVLSPSGTTVRIRKADNALLLAQPRDHNFAHTLRQKLLWGV